MMSLSLPGRPLGAIVALTSFLCSSAEAQVRPPAPTDAGRAETLVVGTARAAAGQRGTGVLSIPPRGDAAVDLPVVVVNGARPGPTLALVAGLHGAEVAGVVALQRLAARLDPALVRGRVIIVPLANPAAYHRLVPHLNPIDGKNLNRVFPGRAEGTQSDRIAEALTREVLVRADYVVDYHGGDLDEDQRPYAYWIQTGDARRDAVTDGMLRAFGIDWILKYPAPDLVPATAGMLPTQAISRGTPTISVDAGRAGGYTSDDLRLLLDGTLALMSHLAMLPPGSAPHAPLAQPTYMARMLFVSSPATGTFIPHVRRGEYVARGARLGTVIDGVGAAIADVVAPDAAVVLYLASTPGVTKGGPLFYLGVPEGDGHP
jgi:predicted deacylase